MNRLGRRRVWLAVVLAMACLGSESRFWLQKNAAPAYPGAAVEEELQLTEEQEDELETIYASMQEKFLASRNAPESERQRIAERNRNDMRAQITGMLTPEQRKKYEEIVADAGYHISASVDTGSRHDALDDNLYPKTLNMRTGSGDGMMNVASVSDIEESMAQSEDSGQFPAADRPENGLKEP